MNNRTDIYHRWVEWSEEDQVYIGRCPDLFLGGCHGDDPLEVAKELQEIINEWDVIYMKDGKDLPSARVRPVAESA